MRDLGLWFVRVWCLLCVVSILGCGGGGGGGASGPATLLGRFEASLSGAAEGAVVDPAAKGFVAIELFSDGTLSFVAAAEPGWVEAVSGFHIHTGAAGVDGPILVDLLGGGASFDVGTRVAQDTLSIPPADAAAIAAAPAQFYVNVHTSAASGGLARGQLAAAQAREWHAVCLGSEETPPNVSAARAVAALRVLPTGELSYVIALKGLVLNAVTMAHVHEGARGVPGPIFVDLDRPAATVDAVARTLTHTVALTPVQRARIALDPAGFYVNVHSIAQPTGEVRGQLRTGTAEVWAHLRGDRETTVLAPSARGGATLELETFTTGHFILAVPVTQFIVAVTQARLHAGVQGAEGPIVLDLMAGPDFTVSASTGSGEGSITFTQDLFARLLVDPAAFYVDIRTAGAPSGLARGQCTQAVQSLVGLLSAANEIPAVGGGGSGKLRVFLRGVHDCQFSLKMTTPPAGDIVGLHVHDGGAGANGPILIDLLGGEFTVDGNEILGSTPFTGRTFARLLANAAAFYGNAHTATFPDGAARGQLLLLTEDSPPAGLVYTSPVTYTTGVEIADNVPDSIGGSIASYVVVPALPAGLTLDPVTGAIKGTPTAIAAAANYTVIATNAAGSTQAIVNVTVQEGPPLTLSYATPAIYVTNTTITPNVPTTTGGTITSWSINPALPTGLVFSTSTGVISGTPTVTQVATDHVVTGSNGAGSVQATVNVRVDASLLPPSGLSYATPVSYTTGTAITANTPTVGGGAVTGWSVSPSLPAGLTLSATTGVISGTPTAVTAAATYTVTASNANGSATAGVNITVTLGAPANLTYSNDPAIGYVSGGGTFPTMTPSSTGGAVASYSITPALPAGVTLNTSTGVISGSPTVATAQVTHTVTATNATGSTTANISIIILQ